MEISSRKATNPLARVIDSEAPEGVGHLPYARRDTGQNARHFHSFTDPHSRGDDFYRGDGHGRHTRATLDHWASGADLRGLGQADLLGALELGTISCDRIVKLVTSDARRAGQARSTGQDPAQQLDRAFAIHVHSVQHAGTTPPLVSRRGRSGGSSISRTRRPSPRR
jgi:hypothetical protein